MDGLVTVKQMAERYGCSNPTARKYLRQCVPHLENPLVAPEWAVREWEEKRTVIPPDVNRRQRIEMIQKTNAGQIIVPRHR